MNRKLSKVQMMGGFVATLILLMAVGVAEEEKADASGQWKYVLEDGGAAIAGSVLPQSTETEDALIMQQIDGYFGMSKDEIIEALGPGYEIVPAGPEGICDGYYYEEMGLAFVFYPDSDALDSLDCYEGFKLRGVGVGSLFSEIMEAFGETKIIETWMELPIYTVYMIQYEFMRYDCVFIAFDKDEPAHIFRIYPGFEGEVEEDVMERIDGKTFSFCSGAGGWSTEIVFSEDGSFSGYHHDSDMGDTGDGYPEGTRHECSFSGTFLVTDRFDFSTYELWIETLDIEDAVGTERIVDGVKVVSTDAYGIKGGDTFILYSPGSETAGLPEAFLEWVRMPNGWEEIPDALPFYGLYNTEEEFGFFADAKQ